ncbi:TPA: thiamine phosphate synthase [Streptococcus agalactiae]
MKDTLKLYFVCGTVDCSRKNILTVVEEALQAGITLFQFREKGFTALQGKEKIAMAKQLQILCKQYQVPFIIDDDIDLVELIDADGLHIVDATRQLRYEVEKALVNRQKHSDVIK